MSEKKNCTNKTETQGGGCVNEWNQSDGTE